MSLGSQGWSGVMLFKDSLVDTTSTYLWKLKDIIFPQWHIPNREVHKLAWPWSSIKKIPRHRHVVLWNPASLQRLGHLLWLWHGDKDAKKWWDVGHSKWLDDLPWVTWLLGVKIAQNAWNWCKNSCQIAPRFSRYLRITYGGGGIGGDIHLPSVSGLTRWANAHIVPQNAHVAIRLCPLSCKTVKVLFSGQNDESVNYEKARSTRLF